MVKVDHFLQLFLRFFEKSKKKYIISKLSETTDLWLAGHVLGRYKFRGPRTGKHQWNHREIDIFWCWCKTTKKHGRYCCELYFSIYFHLWRTKKSDQCMDAPGAECWALGPWPINLGSLGSLQPWEHHEYLRPGTPGIGRNHPECWKARIYRPFCVWYVETDKSRKKLRCSDSLTLGFIDYPV